MPATDKSSGRAELQEAYERLDHEVPDSIARVLRWLRHPDARPVRLPLGILLIVLSFFWFLPIIGIELLPIGLLLIAHDVPFLRKPVARALIWLERKWVALRHWWHDHAASDERRHPMSSGVRATFATRRDAELAVEHLVQEHGMDPADITILPSGDANSAGSKAAGGDVESGHPGVKKRGAPELSGDIEIRIDCSDDRREVIQAALEQVREN